MHSEHPISVGREKIDLLHDEQHGSQTDYVLSFVNHGRLIMQQKNQLTVGENTFVLVPAGVPHALLHGENLDVWWVSFCPSCLAIVESDTFRQIFRQGRLGVTPVLSLSSERADYVRTLFSELQRVIFESENLNLEVLRSLLLLILHEIAISIQLKPKSTTHSQKVISSLEFIEEHFLEPISLKDVAKAIHSSPTHLATLMKKETNYTIGQWITRIRLTEACSRLLHTPIPISDLAAKLGWQDTTHFIRQFKKAYGETPAAWRKKRSSSPGKQ